MIASPLVTVVDDGRLPGGHGSRPFDAEGLATRRTTVIADGTLTNYLFDTYSARRMGSEIAAQLLKAGVQGVILTAT